MAKAKTNKAKSVSIKFAFKNIELVESGISVAEDFQMNDLEQLRYQLEFDYKINLTEGDVGVGLQYIFFYGETQLSFIRTLNNFRVLKSYIKYLDQDSPKNKFLISMTELSLNHTRGLYSYINKDNQIGKFPLPIIDPNNLGHIVQSREVPGIEV